MKTIKRRKAWPKSVRWYAVDEDGRRFVFKAKPEQSVLGMWKSPNNDEGDFEQVGGPLLGKHWTKTLRRIIG